MGAAITRADEGMGFLLRYENVAWYEDGAVRILDRRIYPIRTEFVVCRNHQEVARAIADMVTQSAGPYVAAAMGMALAAYETRDMPPAEAAAFLEQAAHVLSHARPTTSARMVKTVEGSLELLKRTAQSGGSWRELVDTAAEYAFRFIDNNYRKFDRVAGFLADQIPQNGTIMTQCFAETIIGCLLKECRRRDNPIKLICAETRPYYQGARLTASVACDMGFDTTVITDNMPGYVMREKKVDLFTSAADVITMDGYVVNKIGTFQIALAAHYWGIPYFVTGAPNSAHPSIDSVHIELRDPALTMESLGVKTTMEGVKGYYPAFDVTPPKLCSGVVTEKGLFSPYDLKRYFHTDD